MRELHAVAGNLRAPRDRPALASATVTHKTPYPWLHGGYISGNEKSPLRYL